jgi:hypothetical protein
MYKLKIVDNELVVINEAHEYDLSGEFDKLSKEPLADITKKLKDHAGNLANKKKQAQQKPNETHERVQKPNETYERVQKEECELDEAVLTEALGKTVKAHVANAALGHVCNPQGCASVLQHYRDITGKPAGKELSVQGLSDAVLAHTKGNTKLTTQFLKHLNDAQTTHDMYDSAIKQNSTFTS